MVAELNLQDVTAPKDDAERKARLYQLAEEVELCARKDGGRYGLGFYMDTWWSTESGDYHGDIRGCTVCMGGMAVAMQLGRAPDDIDLAEEHVYPMDVLRKWAAIPSQDCHMFTATGGRKATPWGAAAMLRLYADTGEVVKTLMYTTPKPSWVLD